MGKFEDSLKRSIERVKKEVDTKATIIVKYLFTQVVEESPTKPFANYAKGHFINNWYTYAGGITSETSNNYNYTGMASRARIAAIPSGLFYGDDAQISFCNSTEEDGNSYLAQIEYLGWQPPKWTGKIKAYAPVQTALHKTAVKFRY